MTFRENSKGHRGTALPVGESVGDKGWPRRHGTPSMTDTYRTQSITNLILVLVAGLVALWKKNSWEAYQDFAKFLRAYLADMKSWAQFSTLHQPGMRSASL